MNVQYEGFLRAALRDILAIESLSEDLETHSEVICFHAQQAAEKMAKSVYTSNDVNPPKIHDIAELLNEANKQSWLKINDDELRCARELSDFAVLTRYEFTCDISATEAYQAIKNCNLLAQTLKDQGYESILINESKAKEYLMS